MKLTDFPNEVHHIVLSHIPSNGDLANVMLVSHRFRCLAEPHLYSTIHFEMLGTTQELAKAISANGHLDDLLLSFPKPCRLLETLTACPDLGNKISTLSLDFHKPARYSLDGLFRKLPQLQHLSLNPPPVFPVYTIPLELLQSLTSVQLDFCRASSYDYGQGGWVLSDAARLVAKYLSLPNLRRLQGRRIYFSPGYRRQQSVDATMMQYGGSFVDDLSFLDSDAYGHGWESVIAEFISSAKHLKRFAFEINGAYQCSLTEEFQAIGQALVTHYASLEELVLAESNKILFNIWALGNLTGCSSIKRLAIPIHTTFGDFATGAGFERLPSLHRCIPPQLEELQIQLPVGSSVLDPWTQLPTVLQPAVLKAKTRYWDFLLSMRELTENKDAYVPGLKRVVWWFQQSSRDPGRSSDVLTHPLRSEIDELRYAFGKVGVKFEWIATPAFKDTPFGKRVYDW